MIFNLLVPRRQNGPRLDRNIITPTPVAIIITTVTLAKPSMSLEASTQSLAVR